jgi:hypothetical protein
MNEYRLYRQVIKNLGFTRLSKLRHILMFLFHKRVSYVKSNDIIHQYYWDRIDIEFSGGVITYFSYTIYIGSREAEAIQRRHGLGARTKLAGYFNCNNKEDFRNYYISEFRDIMLRKLKC